MWKMARIVLALSTLIAIPALSWYAAMPLTAVTGEPDRERSGAETDCLRSCHRCDCHLQLLRLRKLTTALIWL